MCGICGKWNFTGEAISEETLSLMAKIMAHRGPDNQGIYINRNIGLGHRRLSILDLSEEARQPMSNISQTIWLVFNGEIYNYQELRKDLQSRYSCQFRTQSDSEVILQLYEQEGIQNCLRQLRGMFAFAIWDSRKQTLFLARDRVGKKPLFYHLNSESLTFASTIKAILQDTSIRPEIFWPAISDYISYQYVPSPYTSFQKIYSLPPGHYLECNSSKVDLNRYWKLDYSQKIAVENHFQKKELQENIWQKLVESVQLRLRSDVPFGAFLSGGLDSSLVVGIMTQLLQHPVKTFSIGFSQPEYNELPYAKIVAEQFKSEHHERLVSANDALKILPELAWQYEQPYSDSSAIPSYYVSQLASSEVRVVLNGDGGDENFAGYERYFAAQLVEGCQDYIPNWLFQSILLASRPFRNFPIFRRIWNRLQKFSQAYSQPSPDHYLSWMFSFNDTMKSDLLSTTLFKNDISSLNSEFIHSSELTQLQNISQYNLPTSFSSDALEVLQLMRNQESKSYFRRFYQEANVVDLVEKLQYLDIMSYLPGDLLVKMDVAAMCHSVESRSPFLDNELMELVAKIPSRWKLHYGTTKWVIKKLAERILPKKIIYRPKKGFGIPLQYWLTHEWKSLIFDLLPNSYFCQMGYLNKSYVNRLLSQHYQGKANWQYQIYTLLMLELWYHNFYKKFIR